MVLTGGITFTGFDWLSPISPDTRTAVRPSQPPALRVATVSEHNNFQQKPAFDRKRRGFISVEGVLRDGRAGGWLGRTAVRVSGEMGDSQ
ncbi:MAG: hypothetical protein ACKOTE_03760, partial [Opitutaceae bacterium]